jgi:hypothetical protein
MKIDELAAAVGLGRVRVTNRADEELHAHRLTMDEICTAVARGEIVEQLAGEGKPYPGCRAEARLPDGSRVESVWAWNARTGWAALINVWRVPSGESAAPGGGP